MNKNVKAADGPIINVTGALSGQINGVSIAGKVTGTADRKTGHVTNVFHDIDPAIGSELSLMHLGQTIVCAHMAIEVGGAKNLTSIVPMQLLRRVVTFTLPSHSMQCLQTVAWVGANEAEVHMEYSGSLPTFARASNQIPAVLSEFRQTSAHTIQQSGTTLATFDTDPLPVYVDIKYSIDGDKLPKSTPVSQFLENANVTSSYDAATKKITYNTDVRMVSAL